MWEANLQEAKLEKANLQEAKLDIAAKRRKKHKNQISGLVNSMCYNEQKSKFRLFTNPSSLRKQNYRKPTLKMRIFSKLTLVGLIHRMQLL